MTDKKQVFFVGLDDFNTETLQGLPQAAECDFRAALTLAEMRDEPDVDIPALVELAASRMAEAPGGPAGVASFFDFPGTIIASILAERFGLPGPSLEALLKCEHKYWSRMEQAKVAGDNIPIFRAFDPKDDAAYAKIELMPPFWIKPVKSFRSYLAHQISDERQFNDIMETCRAEGPKITDPFLRMMRAYGMPDEFASSPSTFIAESTIGGAQCTVEGYAFDGKVTLYGVVDSIREPGSSSFARYEYPSLMPLEVQHRMMDICRSVIQQFGYDHGPFNAEFFYDQSNDAVWLLEINPRASQSHADLFHKVHGTSHFSIVVDLALGRKPRTLGRNGAWNVAGHFFCRTHEAGRITHVPNQRALDRLKARQPDTRVKLEVTKGQRLGEMGFQDSYSFELANAYLGGRDRLDLLERYDTVLDALQFEVERASDP